MIKKLIYKFKSIFIRSQRRPAMKEPIIELSDEEIEAIMRDFENNLNGELDIIFGKSVK